MSAELLRELRMLEADYPGQPVVVQKADLREINRLRTQLRLPLVDSRLKELGVAEQTAPPPPPVAAPDHTEAREMYAAYLRKEEELKPHRAYADAVAKATGGPGMTPVRPLATMGTGGGPLLCDQCRKPIILEGGKFQGVPADVAWRQNAERNWNSWISGGMVVEIQTNGTLRIYHGYPGQSPKHCCNVARRNDDKAQAAFTSARTTEMFDRLLAFFVAEFPDMTEKDRFRLVNDVLNGLYSYDPGIGVNRPTPE